jgi:hypothetical protein
VETAKLAGAVREVEASLSKRLSRLEGEVADHSTHIHDLRSKSLEAEQSMGRLLSAVEGFCEQAAQRLETVTSAPAALPAAARVPIAVIEDVPEVPVLSEAPPKPAPPPDALLGKVAPDTPLPLWGTARVSTASPFAERIRLSWWRSPTAISIALGAAVILLGMALWPSGSRPATSASEPVRSATPNTPAVVAASTPNPVPNPVQPKAVTPDPVPATSKSPVAAQKSQPALAKPAPQGSNPAVVGATRIELEATEPSWISIRSSDGTTLARLIEPGNSQSVDILEPAVLRAGNAGGLTIRTNGKSVGPLGPHGSIREVEFKNGGFRLIPVK